MTIEDREAARISDLLPEGPRVAVIGSTEFWQDDSEATSVCLGDLLAGVPGLVLLTGGVEGVGETVGRAFFNALVRSGLPATVIHVLPRGESTWEYGTTLFAGDDMPQRREILARLAGVYVVVEGGPGTRHEAEVARGRGAAVVPVGRSGGHARDEYALADRPVFAEPAAWRSIGDAAASPAEAAEAAVRIVRACLNIPG